MNHSIEHITDTVCKFYNITIDELRSKSQKQYLCRARQMVCLLAETGWDAVIAKAINRDRSGVVNGRKAIKDNMEFNRKLRQDYEDLKRQLLMNEI